MPKTFIKELIGLQSNFYAQSYFGIVLYLFLAAALCGLLVSAAYLFSLSSVQDSEKRSEYECGFEPFDSATRLPFDVHFYLVGILFLIFDVEIALLFPWVLSLRTTGWFGFYLMLGFILLLAIGFLYEWKRGALIWPSRQQELVYKATAEIVFEPADITIDDIIDIINSLPAPIIIVIVGPISSAVLFALRAHSNNTVSSAALSPHDNTNQLRLLAQLPRLIHKARLSRRMKQLGRILVGWRFRTAYDYFKAAKLAESRLQTFKASINFYIEETAAIVSLARSKNYRDETIIAAAEQTVFVALAVPAKEYSSVLSWYRSLHNKFIADPIFKNYNKNQPLTKKFVLAVRAYLQSQQTDESALSQRTYKLRQQLRKEVCHLAKLSRPLLQKRRNAHAGSVILPAVFNSVELHPVVSYFDQMLSGFLPETFLTVGIAAVLAFLAVGLGNGRLKKALTYESLTAFRYVLLYTAALYFLQLCVGTGYAAILFGGYAWISAYVSFFKLLIVSTGYFILAQSVTYVREHRRHLIEYPLTLTLAVLFLVLLVGASHLVSAFIAIVGFSLNLYVLVLFDATSAVAREAGVKYFYLSTLSSGLMIYSIFLIMLVLGTGNLFEMAQILSSNVQLSSAAASLLHLGITFLLVGLFFKLSAFPGHMWAAEVYEGSPDPVTGFFMLPVKISVLGFVVHLLAVTFASIVSFWQPLVMISAVFSLVWGCFAALAEKKTKRFLAYTSINQMGFLLLGLATASLSGYTATLLYLLIYVVMNIGFLTVFLNSRRSEDGLALIYLTDFRDLNQTNAAMSSALAFVLFSMAGIPPLAGFFGKYYLLLHAQEAGFYGLVFAGLVTSLVSAYYYLRLVKIMWFEDNLSGKNNIFFLNREQYYSLYSSEIFLWVFIFYGAHFSSALNKIFSTSYLICSFPL